MNIYHVTVTRTETIEVEASHEDHAIDKVLDGEGYTVDEETIGATASLVLIGVDD